MNKGSGRKSKRYLRSLRAASLYTEFVKFFLAATAQNIKRLVRFLSQPNTTTTGPDPA
jgi:hypothetical protein